MILVADSGSTKTDWACISDHSVQIFSTAGINPVTQNLTALDDSLNQLVAQTPQQPQKIYHYGAGCRDTKARNKLHERYKIAFRDSDIIIETDLLGAARAVCQGKSGLVCILGTGSNAALSDGHQLTGQFPSLGYILGDEGSSSHLAKNLIRAFFLEELDPGIIRFIREQLPQLDDSFIFNFYNEPNQVQKFSEISAFIIKNKHVHEFQNLIQLSFFEFINKRLIPLRASAEVSVHAVGSIAYFLWELFQDCLEKSGFIAGRCMQKPIEGLVNYHKTYEIH